MSRLINADKLLSAFPEWGNDMSVSVKFVRAMIEAQPTFGTDAGEVIVVSDLAHSNWISLEEKPPDNNTDVLLQFKSNMGVGFWEDGDWAINTGDGIYSQIGYNEEKPIAWMSLPEPYQEVEE